MLNLDRDPKNPLFNLMTGPSSTGSYLRVAPAVYDIGQALTLDYPQGAFEPRKHHDARRHAPVIRLEQEDCARPSLNYQFPNQTSK